MLGFTETVLRDANQSLAATRMSKEDFIDILSEMDKVGYYSVECWGGATFDSCIRYLDEDPWERLRLIRKMMPNTKLQMLLRGQNLLGYNHYPTEIVRDFIECAIKNGIDIIRIFDALNDLDNIKDAVKATLEFGGHPSCALCYTVSPVHNVAEYVKIAQEMEALGAQSIFIKDMSGCLMPDKAYELVGALKEVLSVPVILHTHNSSGIAQMTCLKAIEAGIDVIDTAISCFSGGTSQAPTETMALVAENCGKKVNLNMPALAKINSHFKKVFDRLFEDKTINYHSLQTDTQSLISQIPGGMYSNLLSQLKAQGILDRIDEVVAEVPAVRKDLGYPPLVTPISQMVGTQAVANVIAGERYKIVLNEVKAYVLGKYGKAPGVIDSEIKEKIINNNTSSEKTVDSYLATKEKCVANGLNTEYMLIHVMFPQLAEKFFSKEKEVEEGVYKFACSESKDQERQLPVADMRKIDDDILVLLMAIISSHINVDVNKINIKNVYECQ